MHVFISRIPLLASNDEKLHIQFKRTQFPIRLWFAMTINKAQGQTLDFVGIYLREPIFSHGQLYVTLSRAKNSSSVKLLIRPSMPTSDDDHSTSNIVYNEMQFNDTFAIINEQVPLFSIYLSTEVLSAFQALLDLC